MVLWKGKKGGKNGRAPPPSAPGGMLVSMNRSHKFCHDKQMKPAVCGWCRKVILPSGLGKMGAGMRCVACGYYIHAGCEARCLASDDEKRKLCEKADGTLMLERPTFRFKAKDDGADVLIEVNPNHAVPDILLHAGHRKTVSYPCAAVVMEKDFTGPNRRVRLVTKAGVHALAFGSRRERDQFVGCVAYLAPGQAAGRRPVSSVPVRIFVGTWNMGDAPPPELASGQRLANWLHPEERYDVYCVSVQECEYKPRGRFQSCEEDFQRTLEAALGHAYYNVEQYSMSSIRLFLFAKREHRRSITQRQITHVPTGFGGYAQNKGGVVVAFALRETRLCFVGCHLAAHQEKVEARNSDHCEIIRGAQSVGWRDFWLTNQFHHVLWCGDLNYRIDHARKKVVQQCYQGPEGWNALYQYDQLQDQMAKGACFLDFNETQPMFQPTYRMARGANVYPDDAKQRIPSWCDRVLWKSLSHEVIKQEEYTACFTVLSSDHRPVSAVFNIRARNTYVPQSVILPLTTNPRTRPADFKDRPTASHFIVTHLAGAGLEAADANGLSDPYIKFVSPVLQDTYQTDVVGATLNPKWDDGSVPELYCNFDDVAYLEGEYLFLSVLDNDMTSADDPLGQGYFALKGLCDGHDHNFCVRTLSKGKEAGRITGLIRYVSDSQR
eukprot:TRINITY_DN6325_c0_g1_i1.p1 TRINITY_DN6325_c0_g1~~TRINITY_DN6325_c0_g1_i1.p1  ORF type:complete len:664 (+),score=232.70 TRINITY_DN6325_c0_g1_i1:102-2093(+)